MSARVFYIPPAMGASKLSAVRDAIGAGRDYSQVMLIAPGERLKSEAKSIFKTLGGDCYRPPDIQTLGSLCRKIHTTHGIRRIIPPSLIPLILSNLAGSGMGLARIMARFIKDLKLHYPGLAPQEVKDILTAAMEDLNLPEEVAKRALSAVDTWISYKGALDAAGAVDDDDILSISAGIVREHVKLDTLILDGFYEVNNAELALIISLIDRAERTLIFIPVSSPEDDLTHCFSRSLTGIEETWISPSGDKNPLLQYSSARSMEEEVENIVREIKQGYISGVSRELEDIVVAFPGIEPYRGIIERVFHKYGVPYQISRPRPALTLRPFQDLIMLLEAVAQDYPRMEFCRALASGSFTSIPTELKARAPSLCLMAELGGGKESWLAALEDMQIISHGREIFSILAPLENIAKSSSYAAFIQVLHDLLKALGFKPFAGQEEFDDALRLIGTLDDLIGRKVDLMGFIDALKGALDKPFKESEHDGVHVAELLDLRGLEPEYLYFAGLRDDEMPSRPDMDLLMPENLKKQLGLVDMRRHLRLQEMAFTRLVNSARTTRLSYPSMDGDKFFLPSLFLAGAEETEHKIPGIYSEEELMFETARHGVSFTIKEIEGAMPFMKDKPLRVTDIDAYRKCPRRFYIERALSLEPLAMLEYEMEPVTIGRVAHSIMERLGPLYSADPAEYVRRAMEAVDAELKRTTVLDEYFKSLLRDAFVGILPDIYTFETGLREQGYQFHEAEQKIEETLEGIPLVGKADRVDIKPDKTGALIIDYKTGGATLSQTGILDRGETLQLPLYAAMLRAQGMAVDRICIYSLKDMTASFIPGKLKNKIPLDTFIDRAISYLKDTVRDMHAGSYPARPITDAECRSCPETPYCPYTQGAGS